MTFGMVYATLTNMTRGYALTEFTRNSALLHEPEGQRGEGVALRGFCQSEGIKVPVVCSPQNCLHFWYGCTADAGQVQQCITARSLIINGAVLQSAQVFELNASSSSKQAVSVLHDIALTSGRIVLLFWDRRLKSW